MSDEGGLRQALDAAGIGGKLFAGASGVQVVVESDQKARCYGMAPKPGMLPGDFAQLLVEWIAPTS